MPAKNLNCEYILFEQKKLNRTEENGKRLYVTENGEKYPSVTTILSYLSRNKIQKWRKNVGEETANQISRQASSAGTAMHNVAEKYVLGDATWKNEPPIALDRFLTLKPYIDEHVKKIYGIEIQMYSHSLKTAGTADLICEYDGLDTVLDFKTSRRRKEKKDITNYFIQCSAYAIMAKELYDFDAKQIVILMSVGDGTVIEFRENIQPYIKMTQKFFEFYNEGKFE